MGDRSPGAIRRAPCGKAQCAVNGGRGGVLVGFESTASASLLLGCDTELEDGGTAEERVPGSKGGMEVSDGAAGFSKMNWNISK